MTSEAKSLDKAEGVLYSLRLLGLMVSSGEFESSPSFVAVRTLSETIVRCSSANRVGCCGGEDEE